MSRSVELFTEARKSRLDEDRKRYPQKKKGKCRGDHNLKDLPTNYVTPYSPIGAKTDLNI
jgi:hypothetical protein